METWLLDLQRLAGNSAVAALFVQRADYGPEAGKAPAHWQEHVKGARSSADRFALVQSAIQPTVSVVDKTAECSGDSAVNPAHLIAFSPTPPTISYDDNLNAKNGRGDDAGFTKGRAGKEYVVLGPKALKDDTFSGPGSSSATNSTMCARAEPEAD